MIGESEAGGERGIELGFNDVIRDLTATAVIRCSWKLYGSLAEMRGYSGSRKPELRQIAAINVSHLQREKQLMHVLGIVSVNDKGVIDLIPKDRCFRDCLKILRAGYLQNFLIL